jgi:hypothetical protein
MYLAYSFLIVYIVYLSEYLQCLKNPEVEFFIEVRTNIGRCVCKNIHNEGEKGGLL